VALASAIAWAMACSGRKVGPSSPSSESPHVPDGAYGGSFPVAAAPARDDGDATATGPSLDSSAGDENATAETDGVALEDETAPLPDGACAQPPGAGALRIDELMIASVAGSGDSGEWLEIENVLDCVLDLNGLHGECPHGSKVTTFDVTDDVWIPPHGTFVVADSSDPAINHDVPGVVFAWFAHPGDVLRNQGTTITVSLNGAMLDTLTYPSLALAVGDSLAFPEDCDPSERLDFTKWKRSTASWFPGFLGTPNAPNDDVMCP
jgi:hypothetical protein